MKEETCHVCNKKVSQCDCSVYTCPLCGNIDTVAKNDQSYSKRCAVDGEEMEKTV